MTVVQPTKPRSVLWAWTLLAFVFALGIWVDRWLGSPPVPEPTPGPPPSPTCDCLCRCVVEFEEPLRQDDLP